MYDYTSIAHLRANNNVATPNPIRFSDVLITSITPTEVNLSVQGFGVPTTATFKGSFTYTDVPTTLDALVNGTLSGTLFSKSAYRNGVLNFQETWVEGVDWLLVDTDFAYDLSKLSGNDYFEGSRTTAFKDSVQGLAGNDRFKGNGDDGGDYFFGGDGIDTSIYRGKLSEYVVSPDSAIWDGRLGDGTRVSGYSVEDQTADRDGKDYLNEVERLQFSDKSLALDVGATQNAGKAKLFTGAIAHSLANDAATLGTILHFIDNGYSDLTSLSKLAIDVGLISNLAGGSSNEALAGLVTANLLGEANAIVEGMLLGYMNGTIASYSQAQFLGAVAALEVNQQRVDLTGLAETGMEYIPLGL